MPKLVVVMPIGWVIFTIALAWVAFIGFVRWVLRPWLRAGPRGDPVVGFIWRFLQGYARLIHRATWRGLEELRDRQESGPLIVVSNHTGSVDPLLIQAGCRFHIRWMMASEMITPWLDFIWRRERPIPVDRDGKDTGPAREAIRHIQAGGAVGIYPEGRIVWPPRQMRPFFTGVGLIVARTKAPVMLIWISGTPDTRSMSRSIFQPSRARIEYIGLLDFKDERDAHVITQQLREKIAKVSGWPLNDEPQPPPED